jgi:hypothetical protein
MTFTQLINMIVVKANRNGVDLSVMEKALGITQHNNSDSYQLTNQSDINASKKIQRHT